MEIEKVKRTLLPAIRQYRYNAVPINDQDKFVCGYDYDETNKIMADSLVNPLEPLVMEKIADIVEMFGDDCKYCENYGWTAEHDPNDPHENGCSVNCPIQVQCEFCYTNPKSKFNLQQKLNDLVSNFTA